MRALVFLLIIANLMFFAWTQGGLGTTADPDALRMSQQLLADQITVVGRDQPPTDPAAAKAEKKESEACLLLSEVPVAELSRVEGLVGEISPDFKLDRSEAGSGGFWVFVPALPNKAEAERKASELKRLKVPEFFVIQEPGTNRFAISLGLFSTREAAEARLEELRNKGVRSAKVGERDVKANSGSLEVRGAEARIEALRQAANEWVPKVKPVPCKASRSTAS